MNLIDCIKEIQKLAVKGDALIATPNRGFFDLSELLDILGEIRPGDVEILKDFISALPKIQRRDDFTPLCIDDYERIADCLRRYQAMAERMAAESK